MKKVICLFSLVFVIILSSHAGRFAEPDVILQKVWVEYDITENGQYGMKVHVDFTTYNIESIPAQLTIYFSYFDGKEQVWLKDNNGRYKSPNGTVSVGKDFTSSYPTSVFTDVQIFMPYKELDVEAGTHDLSMNIYVMYQPPKTGAVGFLGYEDFTFTKNDEGRGAGNRGATLLKDASAKKIPLKTTGPRATFEKLWVEHNITNENGIKGMIIHFKFVTYGMKDVEAYVASFFDYNDGTGMSLKDKNQKYYSSGGNVAVYRGIYPGYDTAYYDDLQVFMPYDEFDLETGDYKLSFETLLIHKEGDVIAKFGWYDFEYSKPAAR